MSDTPEPRLTHFMMKLKGSQTDPVAAAAKGVSGDTMTTYDKGSSISATAKGSVLDGGKLKVNFVPVQQLKEIVGIGDKISKRMHMLRLSQRNLNAKKLNEEFGRKMTAAMLSQMDFEMNDMLIPKLKPKKLEDDFSSGSDTEGSLKLV
ncbi:hypothetical protein DPMN_027682 [Dreissena polymorpha]|uniref:Uncharacterized protein n=1 Tax=Dreissena polymorpha TaxID=45954 RepID=A0A9D4RDV3_DREPO|nr:hypothetical protein DPMN_027682 [Dreissena polymorpha]